MRKALLVVICLLVAASPAFAQMGSIGVFADPAGTVCDLMDAMPGLYTVYIVHVWSIGATAAQFGIEENHVMMYLSETATAPYIKIGTCAGPSGFGCAIAYGGCYASPNMILSVSYFAQALTPPCGWIRVIEDMTTAPPVLAVTDCSDPPLLINVTGGMAYINNDGSCPCNIPVEETSWGQIKSLYK